jgi:hypothetical protein
VVIIEEVNVEDACLHVVRSVTDAKDALRRSISQLHIEEPWFFDTLAVGSCREYLHDESLASTENLSDQEVSCRAARLLLILAALQGVDTFGVKESLCLYGTRGSGLAYGAPRSKRRKLAALEREKPLRDVRWYVANHLPHTQERIAGQLQALMEHAVLLEEALTTNGGAARVKHL